MFVWFVGWFGTPSLDLVVGFDVSYLVGIVHVYGGMFGEGTKMRKV